MNLATAPDLLTVEEFAAWARIGRSKAYLAVRGGDLPGAVRIGRTWRIPRHALASWLGFELDKEEAPAVNGDLGELKGQVCDGKCTRD